MSDDYLARIGTTIKEARHRAGLSQSTVSAHLATLQKAGLVTCQKVGQWHFFKRNDAVIQTFIERIGQEL